MVGIARFRPTCGWSRPQPSDYFKRISLVAGLHVTLQPSWPDMEYDTLEQHPHAYMYEGLHTDYIILLCNSTLCGGEKFGNEAQVLAARPALANDSPQENI